MRGYQINENKLFLLIFNVALSVSGTEEEEEFMYNYTCTQMQLQMFWAGESASTDGNYNVGFFLRHKKGINQMLVV